ncbi:ATP synthase F(1) complex subunit epsilon, mitochondrial-like [Babylonia areolata]|uniref:ATP synthase F(1) complex subunit epsilon, mitochondrial-like n=1 Tax=Babylonia areolata TaxID=304850 RepID=UPI003FD4FAE4
MSTFWRQVGLNYINYSQICAKVVRRCLKPELRSAVANREETIIKTTKWDSGKVVQQTESGARLNQ